MTDPEILAYYTHGLEQDRLAGGGQRIEFLRMRELLARWFPAPPATVVDIGGGAGAYALPLAADGYKVHLIDPVRLHIDQALAASARAARPLASALVGDARQVPAADGSADAVLLLGPLYHLPDRRDRVRALRETCRVLRPGGVVVAAALSRFYPVLEDLARDETGLDGWAGDTARFLADGQYRNPDGDPALFTTSYFHQPAELASEIAEAGLSPCDLIAGTGIVKLLLPQLSQRLDDPEARERVLAALRALEAEPTLLGMSQNLVAVARAPRAGQAGQAPFVLRTAETGDIDALLELWRDAAENSARPPDTHQAVTALLRRDPEAVIIAAHDGNLIGSVIAGWDGWRGHLYRLAVHPAWRRRGVGSALLRAAESRLRALGADRSDALVLEANTPGQALWEAAGYRRQEEWRRWVNPLRLRRACAALAAGRDEFAGRAPSYPAWHTHR
jgi:ribosomal protein S18 acetylase RimI-like enzyme/SAM-dependent methyltransferase